MIGRARRRAAVVLDRDVEVFGSAGYRESERRRALETLLEAPTGKQPLVLRLAQQGRIFGGTYALEISTAAPVLPPTGGVSARGRGVVKLSRFSFHPRRGDSEGKRLASVLAADRRLADALREVHFERVRVEPDGRAVIRHMGGSLVWILFPPLARPIPLVPAQATATARALDAFAAAGRELELGLGP